MGLMWGSCAIWGSCAMCHMRLSSQQPQACFGVGEASPISEASPPSQMQRILEARAEAARQTKEVKCASPHASSQVYHACSLAAPCLLPPAWPCLPPQLT